MPKRSPVEYEGVDTGGALLPLVILVLSLVAAVVALALA